MGSVENGPLGGIHTVNECEFFVFSAAAMSSLETLYVAASVDAFLEIIRFFTTLILNADESTSL